MKKHLCFLLILCSVFVACTSTQPLIPANQHDAKFEHAARKIEKGNRRQKHVKAAEGSFQAAHQLDMRLSDSIISLDAPERWIYANAIHRRMKTREEKLATLNDVRSKEGYSPVFTKHKNIAQAEQISREYAADYLYEKANTQLALARTQDRLLARRAFDALEWLHKDYFPAWKNSQVLMNEALNLGTSHFLIETHNNWQFQSGQFWNDARGSSGRLVGQQKWHQIDETPMAGKEYDYHVRFVLEQLSVGPEYQSEVNNTYTKEIKTGEIIERDTAGNVIKCTPILETVSATVREVTVTKAAYASVSMVLVHVATGREEYLTRIPLSDHFSETRISVSGDERALDHAPMTSTFTGCPMAPSDWRMISNLAWDARSCFNRNWNTYLSGL